MKIFVCSRMNEFEPERKAVIDSLYMADCTPIYFERQISAYSDEEAKRKMNEMVAEADGLIFIYPRWQGRIRRHLNNLTPIQYEFNEFYKKINDADQDVQSYIYVFKKFKGPSEMDSFMEDFPGVEPTQFSNHVELADLTYVLGRKLRGMRGSTQSEIRGSMVVRYNGPDFRGLLERLSDILSSETSERKRKSYRANIDTISFASGAGVATLYFSCSFLESVPKIPSFRRYLNAAMVAEIKKAKIDSRLKQPNIRFKRDDLIVVNRGAEAIPPFQLYLEVRTIDQPGQLHAVARVVNETGYNVDELQLKPAEKDYPRQTLMTLWVSKEGGSVDDIERDIIKLETAIRELAGVRSFSVRVTGLSGS